MVSNIKVAANHRNAAQSTGPRTILGKRHSARNALRHGFAAKHAKHKHSADFERLLRVIKEAFPTPALAGLVHALAATEIEIYGIRAARASALYSRENKKPKHHAHYLKGAHACIKSFDRYEDRALGHRGQILRKLQMTTAEGGKNN